MTKHLKHWKLQNPMSDKGYCTHSPWCEDDHCRCESWEESEKEQKGEIVNIWSNEHNAWWRPGSVGYTSYKDLAGKYPLAEAIQICNQANMHIKWKHYPNEDTPVPSEVIVPIFY